MGLIPLILGALGDLINEQQGTFPDIRSLGASGGCEAIVIYNLGDIEVVKKG